MTQKAANDFLQKIESDEEYAKKLVEADSRQIRSELVKGQGFEFTVEELEEAISNLQAESNSEELGEKQLQQVSGGAKRGRGNSFSRAAIKSFTPRGSAGFLSTGGVKCDSSGSEGECVC